MTGFVSQPEALAAASRRRRLPTVGGSGRSLCPHTPAAGGRYAAAGLGASRAMRATEP
jgi:hypothetical protein